MIPRKKLYKILGMFIGVIVLGYFVFYVFFPIMISGPSLLYYIHNNDVQNHTLIISILDSQNKTVLVRSYTMEPDATVEYGRGFGWYPTITWTPFTWSEGRYTFRTMLDNNYTISHTTNVQLTQTITISITSDGTAPLKIYEVMA